MKRPSVYLESNVERYLKFREGDDLIAYEEQMLKFIIPSDNTALLKHMQAASTFLDEIYGLLFHRACREERESDEIGNIAYLIDMSEYDEKKEEELHMRESSMDALRMNSICDVFLRWHTDIVLRGELMTGLYAINYFLTWGSFVRAFHLAIYRDGEKCDTYANIRADEHRYCKMVNRHEKLFITEATIIEYRISELFYSIRMILPSLYAYAYCNPMRSYIYTLFFRYADLLAVQQDGDDTVLDAIFDNPLFATFHSMPQLLGNDADEADLEEEGVRRHAQIQREEEATIRHEEAEEAAHFDKFDAYKKIHIPANKSYSINNEFLYQGEALFYYQLRRIQLSDDLIRYHKEQPQPIVIRYTKQVKRLDFIKLMLEHWSTSCIAISIDTFFRKPLVEQYTTKRADMHLWHGERERYKRQFPSSTGDARDILQTTRSLVMNHINNTQQQIPRNLITAFKKSYLLALDQQFNSNSNTIDYEREAIEHGLDNWRVLEFEHESLFLTKLSITLFLDHNEVPAIELISASFILEELVTLQYIEKCVFLNKKPMAGRHKVWPIYLKLARLYYVIDTNNNRLFKSLFFVEAYFVWLLVSKRLGLLNDDNVLPPALLAPLKILNTLLQF